MKDEIIEEVRAVRRKIFAQHDYDLDKLCDWLMEVQQQHPERLAADIPKRQPEPAAKDEK